MTTHTTAITQAEMGRIANELYAKLNFLQASELAGMLTATAGLAITKIEKNMRGGSNMLRPMAELLK